MSSAQSARPHHTGDRSTEPKNQRDLSHRLHTLDDIIHASEEAEDKYSRIAVERSRRIPPVPDLRFEYSYLRGVSQYISLERVSAKTGASEKGKEKAVEEEEAAETLVAEGREVVHVQWGPVLWVTTRDQIISPLLQGALWYVFNSHRCTEWQFLNKHAHAGASRAISCDRSALCSARTYAHGGREAVHGARMQRREMVCSGCEIGWPVY